MVKIYCRRTNVPPSHGWTTPFSILACILIVQSLWTDVTSTSKQQEFQIDGVEFLLLYSVKSWCIKCVKTNRKQVFEEMAFIIMKQNF